MSERKLIALGTGSQVPGRSRNHNGYFLRWDEQGFLFDPGEGTQRQMIYSGVSASAITKIFITHFHGDHCLGLAGVLQRIALDRVTHPVEVYFPQSGQRYFENLFDSAIYFKAAAIVPRPVKAAGIIFEDERLVIRAAPLDHGVDTFGYRITEKDAFTIMPAKAAEMGLAGPVLKELKEKGRVGAIDVRDVSIGRPGQSFAFVMDTRPCRGALELAAGVDMLLCEATYLEEHRDRAEEYRHMTALEAGTLAREAGASRLLMAHYSHRYSDISLFEIEAGQAHPDVRALDDGDAVSMPRRRRYSS